METIKWVKLPVEANPFLDAMSREHDREGIAPMVCDKLRENPVTRISYAWMRLCSGGGGLSPFALAGVAKVSPKRVLAQAAKEPYMSCIDLCVETLIPIVFPNYLEPTHLSTWGHKGAGFPNRFNKSLTEFGADYGMDPKKHTFEWFMAQFGGATWRRHCTRRFDPMGKGCEIQPEHWKILREFYLGRKLRT